MPVDSSQSLLQVLQKCSLLSPNKLQEVRKLCEQDGDAKSVARTLIKSGALTKWQALQLLAGRYALSIGEYELLDQLESDESTRVFLTRQAGSDQLAVLKTISRRHSQEDPVAVDRFVGRVEQEAAEQDRAVLTIHRPDDKDDRCYVVVAKKPGTVAVAETGPTDAESPAGKSIASSAAQAWKPGEGIQIDAGNAARPGPAAGAIAIDTGPKRRRKRRKKVAKAAASSTPPKATPDDVAAAPAEADEGEAAADAHSVPTGLIIAGAVAAGLLMTTGIVLTLVFLLTRGGDSTEVAGANPADVAEAAEAVVEPKRGTADTEPADPEVNPEIDPVIAPVSTTESAAESDPAVSVTDSSPPAAEDNEDSTALAETPTTRVEPGTESDANTAAPGEMADSPPSLSPLAEAASAAGTSAVPAGADTPSIESTAMASVDQSTPTAKTAAGATQAEPTDAAAAADQPPAEPKPKAKTKTKPKAEPAVPDKEPFADLAAVLALPDLAQTTAGRTEPLGSVYIPEGELCFIKLRGGVDACKGSQMIRMRNADGGLAERDWEIFAQDGDAGPEVKIAHLAVNDQHALIFRWEPAAREQPVAAYLVNCAFSLSCSGQSHVATLRQPTRVEGMLVGFKKSVTKEDWPIEWCPEPKGIRMEITGVQGAKYTVEPAPILEADGGEALIRLQDGGGVLSLKLETSMRRNLQVGVEPYIQLTPDMPAQKFSSRVLTQYAAEATTTQQRLRAMVQQSKLALQQRGISEQQKKREIQPRLALVEAELAKVDTALKDLQALSELMTTLSENMRLNFRVFYDADSSQVDLLQIGS